MSGDAPVKPLRIAVVHAATGVDLAAENADTLVQVDQVTCALNGLGHSTEVVALGLDLNPLRELGERGVDVVFNLVEDFAGSDALLSVPPALLDTLGVPYTGASADALARLADKTAAKLVLATAGLPTPDWIGGRADLVPSRKVSVDDRYIVKSVTENASFGIDAASVVTANAVSQSIAHKRSTLGGEWFAERYIDGREFNLAMLAGPEGPEVLPPAEMTFIGFAPDAPRIVDYEAKWAPESHAYRGTLRSFDFPAGDAELIARLEEISLASWTAFGLSGYARVDFRVDTADRPFVLEVNPNPCLSRDAGFVAAAAKAGLDYATVIQLIVEDAGARHKGRVKVSAGARR